MRKALILTLLLYTGIAHSQVAIDTAIDFTVKDVHGVQHHLFGYLDAGNHVVLDFFTTNCGPCQTYASEVSASFDYFGCNGGNVVFMGINWGSDNGAVQLFDSLWGAHYPSVSGLQGGGNNVVDIYQVQSYPSVILIAPDRSIINNHIWPPFRDTINAEVLMAGGLPQSCTVGLDSPGPKPAVELQVIQSGKGNVTLKVKHPPATSALLQIFSSDGRLITEQVTDNTKTEYNLAHLKPGIYVASILMAEGRKVSVKFLVN